MQQTMARGPSSREPRIRVAVLQPRHVASIRMATERRRVHRTVNVIHEMVMDAVGEQGLAPAGPLFARFHHYGPRVDVEAGLVLAQPIEPIEMVQPSQLPGGEALHLRVHGGCGGLEKARATLASYGASNGFRPAGAPWECYLVDEHDSDESGEWLTDLYLPVRARRVSRTS